MDQKRSSMLMHDGRILGAFYTKQDRWKNPIIQYRLVIRRKEEKCNIGFTNSSINITASVDLTADEAQVE